VQAVPRLCEFYPGICLITEEKERKNLSQGKKNLIQSTYYQNTYTLQKPTHRPTHTHTHTHTHTLQNLHPVLGDRGERAGYVAKYFGISQLW
jgi:hypothetical protein